MKTYKKYPYASGTMYQSPDNQCFPESTANMEYRTMLEEVAAEQAEIVEQEIPSPVPPNPTPKVSAKLFTGVTQITENTNWQSLGGVAVNVQFYVPDLTKASAIVEMNTKANGAGAQLRLVEIDADENERVMCDPVSIAESNKWAVLKFETDEEPSSGDRTYELQGRLNGANSASVRYCAIVLLENP